MPSFIVPHPTTVQLLLDFLAVVIKSLSQFGPWFVKICVVFSTKWHNGRGFLWPLFDDLRLGSESIKKFSAYFCTFAGGGGVAIFKAQGIQCCSRYQPRQQCAVLCWKNSLLWPISNFCNDYTSHKSFGVRIRLRLILSRLALHNNDCLEDQDPSSLQWICAGWHLFPIWIELGMPHSISSHPRVRW